MAEIGVEPLAPHRPVRVEGISHADAAAISAASHDTSNKAGFTGGAQGGYNYIYNNQWLFGGEVDWEGIDIRSASNKGVPSTVVPGAVYTLSQDVSAGWLRV